jgi:hypothetical protein
MTMIHEAQLALMGRTKDDCLTTDESEWENGPCVWNVMVQRTNTDTGEIDIPIDLDFPMDYAETARAVFNRIETQIDVCDTLGAVLN